MYNTKSKDFQTSLAQGSPEQIPNERNNTKSKTPSRKAIKQNKDVQTSLAQGAHGQTSLKICVFFMFVFFSKVYCFLCCCAALRRSAPLRCSALRCTALRFHLVYWLGLP